MTNDGIVEEVYDEERATGATSKQAAIVATSVLVSPAYRAAWLAGRAERLREREEKEEDCCPCLTGCEECGGIPVHE